MSTLYYRIFDLRLESNVVIAELPLDRAGVADLRFRIVDQPPSNITPECWQHEWRGAGDRIAVAVAEIDDGSLLRFADIADFHLDAAHTTITGYRYPETPAGALRHLLIDQVIPRVLAHQGAIVIHASAARVHRDCVAFLGPSGTGKSTLAASFLATGGAPFADDALQLIAGSEGVAAITGYPGLRIWPPSESILNARAWQGPLQMDGTAKRRYTPLGPLRQPERLKLLGIFTLSAEPDTAEQAVPVVRECSGSECLADLIKHTFVLNPRSLPHQIKQLRALAGLANTGIGFFRLSFPRRFDQLPRVRQAVLDAMGRRR